MRTEQNADILSIRACRLEDVKVVLELVGGLVHRMNQATDSVGASSVESAAASQDPVPIG
jgi:hypothetical protein